MSINPISKDALYLQACTKSRSATAEFTIVVMSVLHPQREKPLQGERLKNFYEKALEHLGSLDVKADAIDGDLANRAAEVAARMRFAISSELLTFERNGVSGQT